MGIVTPKRRLRNNMIVFFVPLVILPLIILGLFSIYLTGQAFDKQVSNRARPELSTFQRNIDFLRRQLQKEASLIANDEETILALISKDKDVLNAFIRSNIHRSYFETLVYYDKDGVELNKVNQSVDEKWKKFFDDLSKDSEGREPSAENNTSNIFLGDLYTDQSEKKIELSFIKYLDSNKEWTRNSFLAKQKA